MAPLVHTFLAVAHVLVFGVTFSCWSKCRGVGFLVGTPSVTKVSSAVCALLPAARLHILKLDRPCLPQAFAHSENLRAGVAGVEEFG